MGPIKRWEDHVLDQVLMSESHLDPIGLLGEPIVIDEADLYGPPRRRVASRRHSRPRPLVRPTRLPGYEAPRPPREENRERFNEPVRRDSNNYEPTPMEDQQLEERYDRYADDYDEPRPRESLTFFTRRPLFDRDFDYEIKKKK